MYTPHANLLRLARLLALVLTTNCYLTASAENRSAAQLQSCDLSCPVHKTDIDIEFYSNRERFVPAEALVLPVYDHYWAVPMEGGPAPLRTSTLITYIADPLIWRRGNRLVVECPAVDIVNCRVYGDRLERCLIMVPGFSVAAIDRLEMRGRPATSSPCGEIGQGAHVRIRVDLQRDASPEATQASWRQALLEVDGLLDENQLLGHADDVAGSGVVFLRLTAAGRRLVEKYLSTGPQ